MAEFEPITVAISNTMSGSSHVLPKELQGALVGVVDGGVAEDLHLDIKIGNVRALTKDDMAMIEASEELEAPAPVPVDQAEREMVTGVAKALDLLLEPEAAEDAVGNLLEAYARRRGDRAHAKRWLWAQTFWIVLNRGIDLLGRVRKAWAGK